MRRISMTIIGLGALLALGGCSMALNGEARYRLHRAFANGQSVDPQLGDVGFAAQRTLHDQLTPLRMR